MSPLFYKCQTTTYNATSFRIIRFRKQNSLSLTDWLFIRFQFTLWTVLLTTVQTMHRILEVRCYSHPTKQSNAFLSYYLCAYLCILLQSASTGNHKLVPNPPLLWCQNPAYPGIHVIHWHPKSSHPLQRAPWHLSNPTKYRQYKVYLLIPAQTTWFKTAALSFAIQQRLSTFNIKDKQSDYYTILLY